MARSSSAMLVFCRSGTDPTFWVIVPNVLATSAIPRGVAREASLTSLASVKVFLT